MTLRSNAPQDIERFVRAQFNTPSFMPGFNKAALPNPASYYSEREGAAGSSLIFVFDDAGGSTPAFTDGVNWRRTSDRAIIS